MNEEQEEMMEKVDEAFEQFKRVDHLIHVSLKYTRTIDVFVNILGRIIETYEFIVDGLMMLSKQQGRIREIPLTPIEKARLVLELYDDETIREHLNNYMTFRKIVRSGHNKINEYRRHVALITEVDGDEHIINIDMMHEYYEKLHEFIFYIRKFMNDESSITAK